jgi:hypothetical protein
MQLVNTSAKRLHCQSEPSAALVGDDDSNAATQANIAHAAITTATFGREIMALAPVFYNRNNKEGDPLRL